MASRGQHLSIVPQPVPCLEPSLVHFKPFQDDIHIVHCTSSAKDHKGPSNEGPEKMPEKALKGAENYFAAFTEAFFAMQIPFDKFHEDIVLEDRINDRVIEGRLPYLNQLASTKVYGNLRYVNVVSQVIAHESSYEEQCVRIHFRFTGMKFMIMAYKFFPKKLWRRENQVKESSVWLEAVSTYYFNPKGFVVRHVIEDKSTDDETNYQQSTAEKLKEKLAKLSRGGKVPAPALYKEK